MPGRPGRAGRGAGPVAHALGGDPGAEGEAGEDDELVERVEPLDIGGRVGLGIAARLGVGEDLSVLAALAGHRREHEVRGPVEDAADTPDAVGGEVQRDRAEERDAAADRRLEPERGAGGARDPLQLGPVMGDHVLVRGDHALAGLQGRADQRAGRLVAAHRLDDHVDVRVGHHVGRGIGEDGLRDAEGDGPVGELLRDRGQDERSAVQGREAGGPVEERADDLAADGSGADDTDAQGLNAHGWALTVGVGSVAGVWGRW